MPEKILNKIYRNNKNIQNIQSMFVRSFINSANVEAIPNGSLRLLQTGSQTPFGNRLRIEIAIFDLYANWHTESTTRKTTNYTFS